MRDFLVGDDLDIHVNKIAIHEMTVAGPLNGILSKLLSAGLFGLGAYLIILLVLFSIFWWYRNSLDLNVKQPARIGLFYITGIFIAGFSNEKLSLKYFCTFYCLMITTLLAQLLYKPMRLETS